MNRSLLVFIILFLSELLFCDESIEKYKDIDQTINSSAQPVENQNRNCLSFAESYEKYVLGARHQNYTGKNPDFDKLLKKHLKCWKDPEVYAELSSFYESQGKYYLAGLVYKEAGDLKKYNETIAIRMNEKKWTEFLITAKTKSKEFGDKYEVKKNIALFSFVFGPLMAAAGLGLFVHDKAFNGTNSIAAQYSLMIGGLSLLNTGFLLNGLSEHDKNRRDVFNQISSLDFPAGITVDEYCHYSGLCNKAKKASVKSLKVNGSMLLIFSLSLLFPAAYSYIDTGEYIHNKHKNDDDHYILINEESSELIFAYCLQILTFVPALASLTGGIVMLIQASIYEKQQTNESIFTLNSITPIINPVSKTYGLALGFSF